MQESKRWSVSWITRLFNSFIDIISRIEHYSEEFINQFAFYIGYWAENKLQFSAEEKSRKLGQIEEICPTKQALF